MSLVKVSVPFKLTIVFKGKKKARNRQGRRTHTSSADRVDQRSGVRKVGKAKSWPCHSHVRNFVDP